MKKYSNNTVRRVLMPMFTLTLILSLSAEVSAEVRAEKTTKKLQTDSLQKSKVVDIAYGQQDYNAVTGSISTVYSKDLQKRPLPSTGEALVGMLPGLTVEQNSGEPGSTPSITIRGRNTYGSSAPLVIVDGFKADYNQLSLYEIESISILKDATAVALYGQDAANGVLLVTTKRGAVGRTVIDFNFSYGVQQPTQAPELLNAREYATLYNQALKNDGLPIKYSETKDIPNYGKGGSYAYTHPDNNYFDQILKPLAQYMVGGINVSGGSDKLRYMVTGGYMHNGGIYKYADENDYSTQSSMNRVNLRANLDIDVNDHFSIQTNIGGRLDSRNYPGASAGDIFNSMYMTPPQEYPLFNPDNSLGGSANYTTNPVGLIANKGYKTLMIRNLDMIVRANYKFGGSLEGLSVGVGGSATSFMQLWDNKTKNFATYAIESVTDNNYTYKQYGKASDLAWETETSGDQRLNFEANASYEKSFGKHEISGMVMFHMDRYKHTRNHYQFSNAGFGFRAHYGYAQKYFAEFAAGYYGQEQYAPGNRFGFFPSIAGAWVVSNENFLKDSKVVNYLKVRGSYGMVGGSAFTGTNIQDRVYYKQYYTGSPDSYFGVENSSAYMGRQEGSIANPDITWDKSFKTDVSAEATLWNHVRVMFDYFHDRRTDILTRDLNLPGILGMNNGRQPYSNGGEVVNKGYEATLQYYGQVKDFRYSVSGGVWFNRSKIVKKPDATIYEYAHRSVIGKPVGQQFGYIDNGFFTDAILVNYPITQTFGDVIAGDTRYVDQTGDNIINNNDMVPIGYSGMPEYTYTASIELGYKGFYLSAMGQGTANSSIVLGGYFIPFASQGNSFSYAKKSWTPNTAETATFPRLSSVANTNNNQSSTVWLRSADYFKLRNVEIGYDFPQKWLQKIFFKEARVYLRGLNLLTVSKDIDFIDPETLSAYPSMRSYNVGVSVKF